MNASNKIKDKGVPFVFGMDIEVRKQPFVWKFVVLKGT